MALEEQGIQPVALGPMDGPALVVGLVVLLWGPAHLVLTGGDVAALRAWASSLLIKQVWRCWVATIRNHLRCTYKIV